MSVSVRFKSNHGVLTKIAKSAEVAGALKRAASNGARGAGGWDGTDYSVRVYTHNKFRARAVVFADTPKHLAHGKHADPASAALRVHPRL